ncbi:MAG TPA: ribosome maturation factor RimP [Ilumatobacter sp.]|jgi:ribosome maturation factor RimP|nr:ribosome maturation factor RimP [Ilumatobacter sp.]
MSDTPMIQRVRELVHPIASDLDLDVYDVEQRGGTLRVTLDTRPGASGSVDLEQLSLATRLISRELDHADPVPGRYTLEVTSPGVERSLRTPAHFQREIGKTVSVRLANVEAEQRRLEGVLVAADERTATIRVDESGEAVDHVVAIDSIDRARTVFVWGPQPKPGKPGSRKQTASAKGIRQSVPDQSSPQSLEERS